MPLNAGSLETIAVIGGQADASVLSGGGSAQVDSARGGAVPSDAKPGDVMAIFMTQNWHQSVPLKTIQAAAPNAKVIFEPGGYVEGSAAQAKSADVAIVFVNQHTPRGTISRQSIYRAARMIWWKLWPQPIRTPLFVLESGGPVAMPWAGQVNAILESGDPGAEAIADILFGRVNPSGKLAVTFPRSDADLPRPKLPAPASGIPTPLDGIMNQQPPFDIRYDQGWKVGYKWYETEVAQIYLEYPQAAGEPARKLIGWEKVSLAQGESKKVNVKTDPLFQFFNEKSNAWEILPGEHEVQAGPASDHLPLRASEAWDAAFNFQR